MRALLVCIGASYSCYYLCMGKSLNTYSTWKSVNTLRYLYMQLQVDVVRLSVPPFSSCKIYDIVSGFAGVIVNTASIAAFDGQVGQAAYSGMPLY